MWKLILPIILASSGAFAQDIIQVNVCKHYNCADATIIQVTDKFYPSNWQNFVNDSRKYGSTWAEFLALKYNIPTHVFEHELLGQQFIDFVQMGRGGCSMYYPSCSIPYRMSFLEQSLSTLENIYGRIPTTLSYGCGQTDYAVLLPESILGGRNSSYTPWDSEEEANTWYGEGCGYNDTIDFSNINNIISRPSSGRFYTDIFLNANIEQAKAFVIDQVNKTIHNNGFYVNFMHWHNFRENDIGLVAAVPLMESLFTGISEGINQGKIAKVDYNEAIEYLLASEVVENISVTNSEDSVSISFDINLKRDIDYSVIQTPVTFRLKKSDFTDNFLNLVSERIEKIYCDEHYFYINILVDFDRSMEIINLAKVDNVQCKEILLPYLLVDSNGLVQSNQPVKLTLFKRLKERLDFEMEIDKRVLNYQETYAFTNLDYNNYDYFLGAINKEKESIVIDIPEPERVVSTSTTSNYTQAKIFPSPTEGAFNIYIEKQLVKDIQVEIYTATGQLVYQRKLNSKLSRIDFNGPSGVYMVELTGERFHETKSLVVNR